MSIIKRQNVKRVVKRDINRARAADAVGEITKGCEIYGLSKGQFSLVELIGHCLDATGPAHLTVSTWTAAGADLSHTHELLSRGDILSATWLVDSSFVNRQPGYVKQLVDNFGEESVFCTANHAKFVILENEDWALVIRTSMNLNLNKRLESYEVSDCPPMAAMLKDLVASVKAEGCTVSAARKNRSEVDRQLAYVGGALEKVEQGVEYSMSAKGVSYD